MKERWFVQIVHRLQRVKHVDDIAALEDILIVFVSSINPKR